MKNNKFSGLANEHINLLINSVNLIEDKLEEVIELCINTIKNKKKILICGNGGSASDSKHFATELICRFENNRKPLPVMVLTDDISSITAIGNDYNFENIFDRQISSFGKKDDLLILITTSGKSKNIINASSIGKNIINMNVVSFVGDYIEDIKQNSDLIISVPSDRTCRIQEIHYLCFHLIAERIEHYFIGKNK